MPASLARLGAGTNPIAFGHSHAAALTKLALTTSLERSSERTCCEGALPLHRVIPADPRQIEWLICSTGLDACSLFLLITEMLRHVAILSAFDAHQKFVA